MAGDQGTAAAPRGLTGGKLIVASHNPGKVAEIAALLAPHTVEIVSAADLGLPEPEETGTSFAANAELKARAAARAGGLPALADDSGLAVDALEGRPGIYSARWGGPRRDFGLAMGRVFDEMPPGADPSARFICALCVAWPDPLPGGEASVFLGRAEGRVVWPPRGERGFGYDPIFIPEGGDRTFGEMPPEEKDAISHRRHAFDQFARACFPAAG